MIATDSTFITASERTRAGRLYRVRDEVRKAPERPRCIECGVKLLLVRVETGMQTCYRHNAEDPLTASPKHEVGERPRRKDGCYDGRAANNSKRPELFRGRFSGKSGADMLVMRRAAGLSHAKLAEMIGVNDAMISRWENENRPFTERAFEEVERVCREERERMGKERDLRKEGESA